MKIDAPDREAVLAEASRSIRAALHVQRERIAARLRPLPDGQDDQPRFPRSMTLRLLMQRPARSASWLVAMRHSRLGGPLFALLALALALRALRAALAAPVPIEPPSRAVPRSR